VILDNHLLKQQRQIDFFCFDDFVSDEVLVVLYFHKIGLMLNS